MTAARTLKRLSASAIVKRGEALYTKLHKKRLERAARGQFAVIDITSGEIAVAPTAIEAMDQAEAAAPKGVFYLLRIGYAATYRLRWFRPA